MSEQTSNPWDSASQTSQPAENSVASSSDPWSGASSNAPADSSTSSADVWGDPAAVKQR